MQPQANPATHGPICVAAGYGLKIHVRHGHLTVEDGRGRDRRTRRYNRATSKLKRLIVLGQSGYVTLDALQWLRDVGSAFVQVDADGRLIAVSAKHGTDRPALRRAQARAANGPAGLEFARWVLGEKLNGQAMVLAEMPGAQDAYGIVEAILCEIRSAATIEATLGAEAQAASTYWDAWSDVPAQFASSARVPDHWRAFGQRHSPLSGSPRLAANPANAILNYLYTIIEAETAIACHTIGLDPGLGVFHVDRPTRASLALDLMEATRPVADAHLLALLTKRTLRASDFVETRRGTCRILRPLARQLAATSTIWASHAAPKVESAARILSTGADTAIDLPTPLSNANRMRAWDPSRTTVSRKRLPAVQLPSSCRDCGAPLPTRRHRYCPTCRESRFHASASRARANAATVLKQLRQDGQDPAHGGRAAEIRGLKNAVHQRAVRDWNGELPDPAIFKSEILPGLRQVPIDQLVTATGLSEHYRSPIRLGKSVPHARHWTAFRGLSARTR